MTFFRLSKHPKTARYKNPDAVVGRRGDRNAGLVPWMPGLEITVYNSRNVYSDGSPWKWVPENGETWQETAPEGFVRFSDGMAFRTTQPRMIWSGWRINPGGVTGSVYAEDLYVHPDDVFPRCHKKRGLNGFVSKNLANVETLWRRGRLDSVGWAGDQIEVGFSSRPLDEELEMLGWKRMRDGRIVDTHTPLGQEYLSNSILLPGHDPSLWDGLGEVQIHSSGIQGCVASSFVVLDPQKASKYFNGLQCVPSGCKVEIEQKWYWYRFRASKKEGAMVFKTNHMPPLKSDVKKISLLRNPSTGRGWSFLISPLDLDLGARFKTVVGIYHKDGEEERCLVTADISGLKYAGVVSRGRVVEAGGARSYKVFSNFPKGRITGTQKMFSTNAVKRLPVNDPEKLEKLTKLYGDAVPHDYYNFSEKEIASIAEAKKRAQHDGYFEWAVACEKSAVPADVFRKITEKGLVKTRVLHGGIKYYQTVSLEVVEQDSKVVSAIVEYLKDNDQAWIVHLICRYPNKFKGAMLAHTFS